MKPPVLIIPAPHAAFDPPKDKDDITSLNDWAEGGVDLSDGTQGLQVQFWNYTAREEGIFLEAPTYPRTLQIAAPNVTWVKGTFDQNMHPAVVYVSNGDTYLWWWDPVVHAQVTTPFDPFMVSPNIVMDDTRDRETQLGNNDIILAYLRAGWLLYRLQRDRYKVEYVWYTGGFPDYIEKPYINRMGMNRDWRFQLEIHDMVFDPYPIGPMP